MPRISDIRMRDPFVLQPSARALRALRHHRPEPVGRPRDGLRLLHQRGPRDVGRADRGVPPAGRVLGRHAVLGAGGVPARRPLLHVRDLRELRSERRPTRCPGPGLRRSDRTVPAVERRSARRRAPSRASTGRCSSTTRASPGSSTAEGPRGPRRRAGTGRRGDVRPTAVRGSADDGRRAAAPVHGGGRPLESTAAAPRGRRAARGAQPREGSALHRWPVPRPLEQRLRCSCCGPASARRATPWASRRQRAARCSGPGVQQEEPLWARNGGRRDALHRRGRRRPHWCSTGRTSTPDERREARARPRRRGRHPPRGRRSTIDERHGPSRATSSGVWPPPGTRTRATTSPATRRSWSR